MLEPTPDLQPSVAQIVADALMSAADGLARWLGHRIDAKQMVAAPVGGDALQGAIAPPNDVICCCTMPVDWTIIRPEDSRPEDESSAPPELQSRSAGRLLLGWSAADAAWLIDESLHQTGTSSDQSTWGNLQRSAIAETSNVVGCDFLNAIAQSVRDISTTEVSLIPRPPHVSQQFAGSLLDSAIIEVESASSRNDPVWVASGNFQVAGHPACTRFVMVWSPNVWKQLIKLVDGAGNGEEST
jgi:hypothetical protein